MVFSWKQPEDTFYDICLTIKNKNYLEYVCDIDIYYIYYTHMYKVEKYKYYGKRLLMYIVT